MNHRELRLAAFVGISSSLATGFMLMGIGSVQAVGPAPSLQTLHEGKEIANRVRAPFVVVDAKDRPIVTISASGDTHFFNMGTLGSGTAIHLERNAQQATVVTQLGSGDTQARMGVKEGRGPRLEVYTKENSTIIGGGANNRHGIFLRDGGGGKGQAPAKVLGELAVNINESGGIVRLYDKSAQPVFSVGGNYKDGGRGQLTLSSPGKNAAIALLTNADGHGELQILGDGNGKPVIELSGSRRHVLLNNKAGNPAAVMRLSQGGNGSGGNFTAVDAAGNNVVSAGALSGGGGAVCAIHPKKGNKCFP
jgi:hypothetical protein